MSNNTSDIIIAQCTPSGSGAIALLRISGDNAIALTEAMSKIPGNKKLTEQQSHTIHYGFVVDEQGAHIDQVLFSLFRAPHSFTGEETVEITSHNNPFIIEGIIQQAINAGARFAQHGEFTRRAFLNKKLDLIQAEAINELINAQTQQALKQSLAQLTGSLSHWIHVLEKELVTTLAWSEASFEFLDDAGDFKDQIHQRLESLLKTIIKIKQAYPLQNQIRQGIRIALIGSVNAGKSSLFNALLGQQRAIVTPIAGTTRDTIEAGLYKNGNYWTLIDTAGLRTTNDVIEQLGIERSKEEAKKADIVLVIFDSSKNLTQEESVAYDQIISEFGHKTILVQNKIDLGPLTNPSQLGAPLTLRARHSLGNGGSLMLFVSGLTGQNCTELEHAIEQKIAALFKTIDSPYLLNQRQYHLLCALEQKLQAILQLVSAAQVHYELVSYHIQEALEQLSELTGKSVSEAGLDAVFKEFCVGK